MRDAGAWNRRTILKQRLDLGDDRVFARVANLPIVKILSDEVEGSFQVAGQRYSEDDDVSATVSRVRFGFAGWFPAFRAAGSAVSLPCPNQALLLESMRSSCWSLRGRNL
jgi:hypothetical protein